MQKKNEIWNVFASVFAIKHEFYQFHPFSLWSLGGKKKSPEKTTNFIGFLETRPKINKKGVFTLKFVILMGIF